MRKIKKKKAVEMNRAAACNFQPDSQVHPNAGEHDDLSKQSHNESDGQKKLQQAKLLVRKKMGFKPHRFGRGGLLLPPRSRRLTFFALPLLKSVPVPARRCQVP